MDEVEKLTKMALKEWQKICAKYVDHTNKVQQEMWETDHLADSPVEQISINIGNDITTSDSSEGKNASDNEAMELEMINWT